MAVIAKSKRTFHQKHQGSYIQSNGNNDLKHGSNHLTAAKLIPGCAKTLLKRQYKEANEAFLREHTTFQEDLTKAVCEMEKWL